MLHVPAESPATNPGEELTNRCSTARFPMQWHLMPWADLFGFGWPLEFEAVSCQALERKLEKDPERSAQRTETWLPEPKKPWNLPLKNPRRKSPKNPTWQQHYNLKLTTPKTDSLRQEEKQAEEAMQTHKEPIMLIFLGNCQGNELPHYKKRQKMPPVRTPYYDPWAHGIPTYTHMCWHHWLSGEHKRSLLLTPLNCIYCMKLPLILAAVSDVNHYSLSASMTSHPCASYFAW